MMSPIRKMAFKLAVYSVFVLYLVGDLYIWHGYLAARFDDHFKPLPKSLGDSSQIVALVYGKPITRAQLDRRMLEMAWLRGELPYTEKGELQSLGGHRIKTLKVLAINDLVNAELLRLKTRVMDLSFSDERDQANKMVENIESRFDGDHEAFMNALVAEKASPGQLRDRITARLKQKQKLESMLKDAETISDEDLLAYYEQVKGKMTIPAHRAVQHLFLATLDKNEKQVETKAQALLQKVQEGESWEELARTSSEDERSKNNGGKLGIISNDRDSLPGVNLWTLPADKPVLVKSRLGWHVMLLGTITPERTPSFDEAREELKGALISLRRERAADIYAENIRKEGRFSGRVEIAPSLFQ